MLCWEGWRMLWSGGVYWWVDCFWIGGVRGFCVMWNFFGYVWEYGLCGDWV